MTELETTTDVRPPNGQPAPAGVGAFNLDQKAPPLEPREAPDFDRDGDDEGLTDMGTEAALDEAVAENQLSLEHVRGLIIAECDGLRDMLIQKNRSYGNSALDPVRIFSKLSATEQLKVRIDDKLSRIARGTDELNEDTVEDLLGYLVLLRVADRAGVE